MEHLDSLYRFAEAMLGDPQRSSRLVEQAYRRAGREGAGRRALFGAMVALLRTERKWKLWGKTGGDPVLRALRDLPFEVAVVLTLIDALDWEAREAGLMVDVEEAQALEWARKGRETMWAALHRRTPPLAKLVVSTFG
jgi:DNA-directed RNA polymerase specialized sigma24 family protein